MKRLLLAAALLATPLLAQGQKPPFTVAESGRGFWRLQDAVNAIGDKDGTIRFAPGTFHDCAIVTRGRIAFVAEQAGTAILDGGTCEGKAALVLRGRDAAVSGLVFQNMAVPDYNGAGIRLEKGPLTVENSIFRNSQEGILTGDDPSSWIKVDHTTFSGLGTCAGSGGCAHGLYVNNYGSLVVTDSRFERGQGGHYLKSRAAKVTITGTSFDDSHGHTTNYMIDLPAGATGTITRNEFVEGRDKENHSALVAVAAEQRMHPSAGLTVAGNRASMAPGVTFPTVLVADWAHEPLKVGPNTLGKGITSYEARN